MGSNVGLKVIDREIYKKVIKLGAKPIANKRAKAFINNIKFRDDIYLLVAFGKMGADFFSKI